MSTASPSTSLPPSRTPRQPLHVVLPDLLGKLLGYAHEHRHLKAEYRLCSGATLRCRVVQGAPVALDGHVALTELDLPEPDDVSVATQMLYMKYRRAHSFNCCFRYSLGFTRYSEGYGDTLYTDTQTERQHGARVRHTTLEFNGSLTTGSAKQALLRVEAGVSKHAARVIYHGAKLWKRHPNDKTFLRVWKELNAVVPFRVYLWEWGSLHFSR